MAKRKYLATSVTVSFSVVLITILQISNAEINAEAELGSKHSLVPGEDLVAASPESSKALKPGDKWCYACSSISSLYCHAPNSKTTMKYCPKGNICVTKFIEETANENITIRDCAHGCEDQMVPSLRMGIDCISCGTSLCNNQRLSNSAVSMESWYFLLIAGLVVFTNAFQIKF